MTITKRDLLFRILWWTLLASVIYIGAVFKEECDNGDCDLHLISQ
jgi:hypothetical protein